MVEILGAHLKSFFDVVDNPPRDADIAYANDNYGYEVWEVSDELFKRMSDMSEEEFIKIAGKDAWWKNYDKYTNCKR